MPRKLSSDQEQKLIIEITLLEEMKYMLEF